MEELRDAIDDFSDSLANTTWRRPDSGLRISPRRLRLIAGDYLPFSRTHRVRPAGNTVR